jgi:enoyl-CoA hydratase/carnithine racemase
MELLLTGEPLGARRAYEVGFVNRVTPLKDLLAEALLAAKLVAHNAPLSVRASKAMVYSGIEAMGMPKAHSIAKELFVPVNRSADAKEGIRARTEGREPQWKGR